MSKPMVVTLPVIMILLDYWPLKRFESKKENWVLWQFKEKFPLFTLSAVLIFITLYTPNDPGTSVKSISLGSRLANAPVSFVTYLAKTFWPQDMAIFYPFPSQIPLGQIVAAALLIIVISAFVIAMIKRLPYLFVGWSWFAITIAPVIGILQIGGFAMADRYHYLPSIGIAIMLAWGIPSLLKNEDARNKILFPAAIACLAIMSVLTWQQCHYWKNSIKLWNHASQVTKDNYMAHSRLGNAYGKLGRYQQAIANFNEVIRLKPDYFIAYNGRGMVHTRLGLYQKALADFNEAIRLKEDYSDAYNNRAFIYLTQGNNQTGCPDAQKGCELGNCKALEFAKSRGLCR
jgi:hypothetical protein